MLADIVELYVPCVVFLNEIQYLVERSGIVAFLLILLTECLRYMEKYL